MDHAEERRHAREGQHETGRGEAPLDDRHERPAPHDGRQDEAVAQDQERLVGQRGLARQARRRGAESGQKRARLDQHDRRGDRHERERDGRAVPVGRREEPLGGDLETDEDQDRRDRRLGEHGDEERQHANRGTEPDHEARRERVSGARAHRLVRGVADVGSVLDDATAERREHRGARLGQEDIARSVLIARRRGALGVVDPADDRDERERQREREVRQRRLERIEPRERRPGDRERDRHRDGRPRVAAAPEPRAEPEESRAGEDRGERPRHPERHPNAAEEPEQQHQERDETHERVAEDLERRQERDQEDRHAGDGAKQGGARHDPTRPVPAERETDLGEADRERRRHAHLPCEHRVAGRRHRRPEHAEHHREQGRRVDAERHRRNVVAPRSLPEPDGEPGVRQVADEDAERRAGNHPAEYEVGRELEDADQEAREDDELRDVVEGEAQEPVEVPGTAPAAPGLSALPRRPPSPRRAGRARAPASARRAPSTTRGSRGCPRPRGSRTP